MKKSVWKYFAESFKKLKEQPVLIIPFLIMFVLILIVAAVIMLKVNSLGLTEEIIAGVTDAASLSQIMPSIVSLGITALIAGVLSLIISAYFLSGATGMALDIASKKKASLKSMCSYGKKFMLRFFGISVIYFVINAIAGAVIYLISGILISDPVAGQLVDLALSLGVFLLMTFFALSYSYLIIQNKGVFASIGKSLFIVKNNYLSFLLIWIMFNLLSALVSLIPYAGVLISSLIIIPAQIIALVLFALDHNK